MFQELEGEAGSGPGIEHILGERKKKRPQGNRKVEISTLNLLQCNTPISTGSKWSILLLLNLSFKPVPTPKESRQSPDEQAWRAVRAAASAKGPVQGWAPRLDVA